MRPAVTCEFRVNLQTLRNLFREKASAEAEHEAETKGRACVYKHTDKQEVTHTGEHQCGAVIIETRSW